MDTNKLLANARKINSYKIESEFRLYGKAKSKHSKCIKHVYIARERGTPYIKIGVTKNIENRFRLLNVSSYGGFKLIASRQYAGHCYILERNMKLWFAKMGAMHGEGTEMFVFDNGTDAQIKQIFENVISNNVKQLKDVFELTRVTKSMSKKQQLNLLQA